MNPLHAVQNWYLAHANGDWEHDHGILIESLDNPGWRVTINLTGTELEHSPFQELFEHTLPYDPNIRLRDPHVLSQYYQGNQLQEWLHFSYADELGVYCHVEAGKFIGIGGANKLDRILEIFINWTNQHEKQVYE